jgi:hypothetical protein
MKRFTKPTATAKGNISVDGVRTIYENDGKTVKDQCAVLKVGEGIFSKRFLVPLTMFTVDDLTKAMVEGSEFFPADTELKFKDVTPVSGSWRTYEGTLTSIIRPISTDTLVKLIQSQTIVKNPT